MSKKTFSFLKVSVFFLGFSVLLAFAMACTSAPAARMPNQIELKVPAIEDSLTMGTFTFAVKGEDTLDLDIYQYIKDPKVLQPVMIFVHGGGFYAGTRKEDNIHHFCEEVAKSGYTVLNISYRLYLKGRSFHCSMPNSEKINAFRTAVSDLRTSTQWLLDQTEYSIDPNNVYIAGSSAGAEAVLHAGYWDAAEMNLDETQLNDSFDYAGILAFAGAMVDTTLINKQNNVPLLMYHGTCDPLVPYGSAIHHFCPENSVGGLPLHGSKSIMERQHNLGGSYKLVSVCGGKHGQASIPISKHIPEIISFLNDCVERKSFQTHEVVEGSVAKCKYGKEWSPCN